MAKFDPPADPFGDEKHCRICDGFMEYDSWMKEWYCPADHEAAQQDEQQTVPPPTQA